MTQDQHPGTVAELLPFYVNGSLSADERRLVEAALEADDQLRREVEALETLRETWRAQPEADVETPGEAGLARVLGEIDALGRQRASEEVLPTAAANVNAPLRLWQQVGALVAAIAFGAILSASVLQQRPEGDVAVPASGPTSGRDLPTIAVLFKEEATLAEISNVLREAGLVVVDGPSAVGLYRLATSGGGDFTANQAEALRARKDIFELVDDPL